MNVRPAFVVVLVAVAGAAWLSVYRRDSPDPDPTAPPLPRDGRPMDGRWTPLPDARRDAEPPLTAAQIEEIKRLEAIGYLDGSQPAPSRGGVTRIRPDALEAGYTLMTSGDSPGAELIALDGAVVHRWSTSWERAFSTPVDGELDNFNTRYLRRVELMPDGGILGIFEGLGVVALDRDSHVRWSRRNGAHHALDVSPTGDIYVLTRRAHLDPSIDPEKPILEDYVEVMRSDGTPVRELSVLAAFRDTPFFAELRRVSLGGDLFHTNSIQRLDGRLAGSLPWAREGNLLVSLREEDLVAVIDPATAKVVWTLRGGWRAQHDVQLLPDGTILLFDNRGLGEHSRVLEIDPSSGAVRWVYQDVREGGFYTPTCGTSQRLAGGTTLVTESDYGRAFEVTEGGDIVWEYVNAHRAGPNGQYIATLFEARRYLREELPWLSAGSAAPEPLTDR